MDQHDNHCVVSFMGLNWYIIAWHSPLMYLRHVRLRSLEVCCDTSQMRWDEFTEAAVARLRRMYGYDESTGEYGNAVE